jgi:hypothetical protein
MAVCSVEVGVCERILKCCSCRFIREARAVSGRGLPHDVPCFLGEECLVVLRDFDRCLILEISFNRSTFDSDVHCEDAQYAAQQLSDGALW